IGAALAEELFAVEGQESEMAETPIEEMLRDAFAQGAVVDAHPRHPRVVPAAAELDDGHGGRPNLPREGGGPGPDQDAVALPSAQPGRRLGLQRPGFEVDRPGAMLAQPAPDPLQDVAAVGPGSFDQQGDMPEPGHLLEYDKKSE